MRPLHLRPAAVSVTGGISFIGLMAPHIAKSLVGPRHQIFMPIALLIGGWLLLLADTIGRNIVDPNGIPAGIVVALIGAPYFMYLLLKKLKKHPQDFLRVFLFHSTVAHTLQTSSPNSPSHLLAIALVPQCFSFDNKFEHKTQSLLQQ